MKNLILYLLIALLCGSTVQAQTKQRLIDNWEFLRTDLGNIWEGVRPYGKGSPESVPIWEKIKLPHSYNAVDAVDPDVNYYQGPSWYRTYLDLNNPYQNGHTILHFEGVGQKAQVFVYDQEVGSHVGGYDEWYVDITDAVADFVKKPIYQKQFRSKVPVLIRVDNTRDTEMIPSDLSDFNIYGGIYRYLNLVYLPQGYLERLEITPVVDAAGKKATIKVEGILNPYLIREGGMFDIEVKNPNGKTILKKNIQLAGVGNEKALLLESSIDKALLWSPHKPNLYTVEVRVGKGNDVFVHKEKFGFRHFEFKEQGPFFLNGKVLLLRGTHRHEDHAGVGPAMTEDMMLQEMRMMKEMGVNFIRLGHYQQSKIILDACDSLGILVWEEIPWCRGGLGGDIYQRQAKDMLTNMINQHRNHPSIILWGMGNENDWPNDFPEFDQQKIRAFMKELHDLSHKLDDSRLTAIRRCDFCKDIVDVYSPSIWAGWYRGLYTDYKSASETEYKRVKHFLHVEWGGDSHARRHSENPDKRLIGINSSNKVDERSGDASLYGGSQRVSKDGDWSESYICNLIDWHLKEQETMPWLTGTAYWPFKDFSTPVRPENPVPYVNQKGVVERDFTKKESFYVFQSYWTEKLMAHIYGHSWPIRWGDEGEEKMIKVYSNAAEAELFLNGKSLGVKKRNSQDFPAAGLRWSTPLRNGENHVRVLAKRGKQEVIDEISFNYETRKWGKPTQFSSKIKEEKGDLTYVEFQLLDKDGVPCLDNTDYIEFDIVGNGTIVENQGTSTGSRSMQAYNGRGIVTIRNAKGSVLQAKSKAIQSAFISL